MSHGQNSRSLDHAKIAKSGFLAGLGLFVVGAVGELAGHSAASSMSETGQEAGLGDFRVVEIP